MAEVSVAKPFAAGKGSHTPLENLVRSALVRAGNFSPARVDGEVMMMFIEDRAVPDLIMIDGLTAHYSLQQGSEKAMVMLKLYQAGITDILHERANGNKGYSMIITDVTPESDMSRTTVRSSTGTTVTTTYTYKD